MGALMSRERLFAGYERGFERIDAERAAILARQARRSAAVGRLGRYYAAAAAAAVVGLLLQAAWVHRQPRGTFSLAQHFSRVLPALLAPLAAYALWVAGRMVLAAVGAREARLLGRLEASRRRMLQELRDATRYDTTHALIARFDPDARRAAGAAVAAAARAAPARR